ncbi:MAG: hypothetical protein RR543_02805 [Erysipelotrichales bacterium]
MKCYNCDKTIKMDRTCPYCHARIDRGEYELDSTNKILRDIKTKKDFARFIGLFYLNSYIFLALSIISLAAGFYMYMEKDNVIGYIFGALIFLIFFNYFIEMRRVESFYRDFQKGENKYYVLYPFRRERRVIVCDASDKILKQSILDKRYSAYEKREDEIRLLRVNSHKFLHPQKLKLFYTKEKFYKRHFNEDAKHLLKTHNSDDESYVGVAGVASGFLMTKNGVITIYNTPKLARNYLPDTRAKIFVKDVKKRDNK